MVPLFVSILSMCIFHAMGSAELKLGQSGYELISVNDRNGDDSTSSSSKLASESASRYNGVGALNFEKVTDPINEDDGFSGEIEKKSTPTAKLSKTIGDVSEKMKNQENESSAMIESDLEQADSKDSDNITNLMADVQRTWNLIDVKSDLKKKQDKIERPAVKSGFTMVTHFPSLRIHHQKNSYVSHKSPAVFSPIYPSDFEVFAGNPHKKSAISERIKELHGKHRRMDHKNPKGSKVFGKWHQEKSGQRIPSVLVLNQDHSKFFNQQPIRPMRQIITHLEMNSIPLTTNHFNPTTGSAIFTPQSRWEKIIPRYTIDLAKKDQQINDSDRDYLDSNHVTSNSEVKTDLLKNFFGKSRLSNEKNPGYVEPANELFPPNVESTKSVIIGIAHEIALDDAEEAVIDMKKKEANEEHHEMQDLPHPRSSGTSKSSCKQMKPSTPAFYQFLSKFINTTLTKALEYESNTQTQESLSKLIQATKTKNPDDISKILA